jgi:hypothetical protein
MFRMAAGSVTSTSTDRESFADERSPRSWPPSPARLAITRTMDTIFDHTPPRSAHEDGMSGNLVVDRLPTIDLVSPEQPSAHRYVVHYSMGSFTVMIPLLAVLVGGSTALLAALFIQEVRQPGRTVDEVAFLTVMAALAAAFGLFMAILG